MLSSLLNSPRAIAINIEIMRTFVRVRELANTHGLFGPDAPSAHMTMLEQSPERVQ